MKSKSTLVLSDFTAVCAAANRTRLSSRANYLHWPNPRRNKRKNPTRYPRFESLPPPPRWTERSSSGDRGRTISLTPTASLRFLSHLTATPWHQRKTRFAIRGETCVACRRRWKRNSINTPCIENYHQEGREGVKNKSHSKVHRKPLVSREHTRY